MVSPQGEGYPRLARGIPKDAPQLLGGLALAPLLIAAVAFRAVMEERLLSAELDGYAAYAARVRWRLVPRIW